MVHHVRRLVELGFKAKAQNESTVALYCNVNPRVAFKQQQQRGRDY
jgi:hypothetical protein